MISHLERTLAEERGHSAELRKAVEDMKFKMQILEQSYAKQLRDARAAAGDAPGDSDSRVAELEVANQETMQLLSEAQDEIHRLRQELAQMASRPGPSWLPRGGPEKEWYEEGTINALMDDDKWTRKGDTEAPPSATSETPPEDDLSGDLISPDWAFALDRGKG